MKKLWVLSAFMLLLTACQESLEDRCARETKEYTRKNCPAKMDNNIVLDSLTFERETHTLHYYYKLTGFADQEDVAQKMDAVNILKNELRGCTLGYCGYCNKTCNDVRLQFVRPNCLKVG